ncbi:MAG: hypothetical protein IT581_11160 [Verrucomicrobiales bacterium]|nr:hypothetical protein [Verrucomicrobiales bacterium]
MNLRKDLQRFLTENRQATQSRRYQWLSGIALILCLVQSFHVFEPDYWKSRRVQKHIASIGPRWNAFRQGHPGFEGVELVPMNDSAWGVVLAAKGKISPDVTELQLYEFLMSTQPPASVDTSKVTTDLSLIHPVPVLNNNSVLTLEGRPVETHRISNDVP